MQKGLQTGCLSGVIRLPWQWLEVRFIGYQGGIRDRAPVTNASHSRTKCLKVEPFNGLVSQFGAPKLIQHIRSLIH